MNPEDYIAGLLAEKANEERAGRIENVKQVVAELRRLGVKPPASERAVDTTPRETR